MSSYFVNPLYSKYKAAAAAAAAAAGEPINTPYYDCHFAPEVSGRHAAAAGAAAAARRAAARGGGAAPQLRHARGATAPPRPLAWSLCAALYGNVCCPGSPELALSVKSRDRKVLGDHSGALSYGSTAEHLNITARLPHIFLVILIIAPMAPGTIAVMNLYYHKQEQPESVFGHT